MSADAGRVHLVGDLTIQVAAEQAELLRRELPTGGSFEVDLSSVTDLDTAGLQVLLATRAAGARRGVEVRFVEVPDCVREILGIVRLDEQLTAVP